VRTGAAGRLLQVTPTAQMKCPQCQIDSIPFGTMWLKSGFGTYRCPRCGAVSRVKRSVPLVLTSSCLGGLAAGLGWFFRSWPVFGVAVLVVVALDALIDSRFRRLEVVDTQG
jgi:phage FluMu protein Com